MSPTIRTRTKQQKPDYTSLLLVCNIPSGYFHPGLCSRTPLSSRALEGLGTRLRGYIPKFPQKCSYNSLLAAYPLLSIFSVECKLRGILLKCTRT